MTFKFGDGEKPWMSASAMISPTMRCSGAASLVENGMIEPGTVLSDASRRRKVSVRPDGTVALGTIVGSIHKIGALAQGLPACNGWSFWLAEIDGTWQPIDTYRARMRATMQAAL